jgi:hypothetical protein
MLPATRGAEVLYANVLRPLASNVKHRAQGSNSAFAQKPSEGFSTAGTTAPSSFERVSSLSCNKGIVADNQTRRPSKSLERMVSRR